MGQLHWETSHKHSYDYMSSIQTPTCRSLNAVDNEKGTNIGLI